MKDYLKLLFLISKNLWEKDFLSKLKLRETMNNCLFVQALVSSNYYKPTTYRQTMIVDYNSKNFFFFVNFRTVYIIF